MKLSILAPGYKKKKKKRERERVRQRLAEPVTRGHKVRFLLVF